MLYKHEAQITLENCLTLTSHIDHYIEAYSWLSSLLSILTRFHFLLLLISRLPGELLCCKFTFILNAPPAIVSVIAM